ncbi:beta-galactosidase [Halalkalibacter akibai]|uniref:Beta-galactosidase n=1 Tax=Halalkalibacter akibai (strain ATCC 43226 / DSM 21942 / CIP 109018 / JCM 9157 / 1139) TaxID=1236973 RepID=W4QYL3_HALA3|nr:beta-galactosidase [Halalkalibacter akibai]GAE36389.1 beta-galactosidase [Halalkalibacter akibai JCM 9157]
MGLELNEFHLGVCYYPEQWPEQNWSKDYRDMHNLGFNVIRVGEFAWSIFEPEEGNFEFDLFDRALDLAHSYGLKVILGTPTATPPAWLTYKYPEVLNVSKSGVQFQHGERRHYNYNSPVYKKMCARIVERMTKHYRHHPAVIGWQIDNELNCHIADFYSNSDHEEFREWLKDKYVSLEALNTAWGATFWNQTYNDWEQVHLTREGTCQSPNPHQRLDEIIFFSESTISFAKFQAEIIRKEAPEHWITTNGMFDHLDNHRLTRECLDFYSYDSYPNFSTIYPDSEEFPLLDRKWSWNLTKTRSVSSQFAVMEQQSGSGGWNNQMIMPSPKPGQMRLWTYQSIAHGADMLLYFRWRTAPYGTEMYWHGLNNPHGQPNRQMEEAKKIGQEMKMIGTSIIGSHYEAEVAIIRDYPNEWDGELDQWHGKLQNQSVLSWFKVLQYQHIPVDALYMNEQTTIDDLMAYNVVIYPHAAIMTENTAFLLEQYVKQGGKVIFGCRTGYKTIEGHYSTEVPPGGVSQLTGVALQDFTVIGPNEKAPTIHFGRNGYTECIAEQFVDIVTIHAESVQVLGTFSEGYFKGSPALTMNQVGNGCVYYYCSAFNYKIALQLLDEMNMVSPVEEVMEPPQQIELSIRAQVNGDRYAFLLNYSSEKQDLYLKVKRIELLSNVELDGKIQIEPFGVYVVKL